MTKRNLALYVSLLLSLIGFIAIGYFTDRANFVQLITLYLVCFALYGCSYSLINKTGLFKLGVWAVVIFRIAFLFHLPNLSDDFYRFVWDGRLWTQGVNPFRYLPSEIIGDPNIVIDTGLYEQLNSQHYFSVYPPVNQFVFFLGALLFPSNLLGSVVIMKIFIFLFEIGSIFLISKLLSRFQLDRNLLFLYALNPLVIIELTGNLHFEAGMIFFCLLAVYLGLKDKTVLSGAALAFAFATKLWPVIFAPFFLKKLGWKRFLVFTALFMPTAVLLFAPVWDADFIKNFGTSIRLYFQRFEFNGSLYYLIRWIGFQIKGYNIIGEVGIWLSLLTLLGLILLFIKSKVNSWQQLFLYFLFALTLYFLFATTVHPWYITPLIAFMIFGRFRYPLIWSCVIPFTYITYSALPYNENILIVAVEYLMVGGYFIFEYFNSIEPKGLR